MARSKRMSVNKRLREKKAAATAALDRRGRRTRDPGPVRGSVAEREDKLAAGLSTDSKAR